MDIAKVIAYIRDLTSTTFHGKIIITFQEGLIVHIEKRQSLKLT